MANYRDYLPQPLPCQCGKPHITYHGHPSCAAHQKHTGLPCTKYPMQGTTVCRNHGGSTPQARAAAKRRVEDAKATAAMARLGIANPIPVTPADALIGLVHWTAGEVHYWRAQVAAIEAEQGVQGLTWSVTKRTDKDGATEEAAPHIAYRLLGEASDRLARYSIEAIRSGIAERQVRLAEQQGSLVAEAFRRVFAQLGLTPAQAEQAPTIVASVLRSIAAPVDEGGGVAL